MSWWRSQWWEQSWQQGWQEHEPAQSSSSSAPQRDAGGVAPEDRSESLQAATAETFAKRGRLEQGFFQAAASASSSDRLRAFGREELRPPEEYLAVNWPKGGHQLYGPVLWADLEETARAAGIEAKCRGRNARHPQHDAQERRCPRLVLLGPRGKALEVAMVFVEAAERILGLKRFRRARRYLSAAAGDSRVQEPGRADRPDGADGDAASASSTDSESGDDQAGGNAPEHDEEAGGFAPEEEADWGDPEAFPDDENVGEASVWGDPEEFPDDENVGEASASSSAGAAASTSAPASVPRLIPNCETRFWAACRSALGRLPVGGRMTAAAADLKIQLESMEMHSLKAAPVAIHGEPKIALACHALNRDYQVKVALPLQCMALLRQRNVGATQTGKGYWVKFSLRLLSLHTH